uniref:C-type lectin domain-containing protein n=2 Tax=Caenorhabditis tropicalis TaxID=1561998 RepID=A0A1I7UNQ6_9PELO
MTLFRGVVDSIENCVKMRTKNSTLCTIQCAKSSECLLALMNESACFHCFYGNLTSFERIDSNYYIALKVNSRIKRIRKQENNKQTSTSLSTLVKYSNPSKLVMPFENSGTCPSGKYNLKKCDKGWRMFLRNTTWICLKVIVDNSRMLDGTEADGLCEKNGAQLSGLDSEKERDFAYEKAPELVESNNSTGIWIDGRRREDCKKVNTGTCNGTTAFDFSDTTLTQKGGYRWNEGEPNGYTETPPQDCIFMIIKKITNWTGNGFLDDLAYH